MWGILLITAAAATPPPSSIAQLAATPYFRTLDASDGLPSSTVWKLAQDRDGYVWIGTADGLARYDGVSFRVYRHDAADATSLAAEDVTALFVDRDDRLWCGGEDGGLGMLDAARNGFRHFRHDDADADSLAGNDVWAIGQTRDGAIWAGGYAMGLDRLDEGMFRHFRHDDGDPASLASDNVLALAGDVRGRLWIGLDAGVDVREADGRIRHVDMRAVPGAGGFNAAVFLDTPQGMLVGTRRGVLRIDAALVATRLALPGLSDHVIYGMARDADAAIWIATRDGLDRIAPDGHLDVYAENAAVRGGLPAQKLFDAMRDREGGLWFATTAAGIAYLPPRWRQFAFYRHDPRDARSLSGNRVAGLAVDARGGIWAVDGGGGIDRLDPVSGAVQRFATRWKVPDKALWSVLVDAAGSVWVGHGNGLRVYQPDSAFRDVAVDASRDDALPRGTVDLLLQGRDGAIWASANGGGIARIDAGTLHVQRFGAAQGLRSSDVSQIGFAPDGALLAANAAGIDRLDPRTMRFAPLGAVSAARILAFAFAADGSLWLHRADDLVQLRYGAAGASPLQRIDAAAGWPTLTAGGMQVDAAGRVWVASARGLWRFDPATRAVRGFGRGDGLASAEFSRLPLVARADGSIFGATLAGIVGFDPLRMAPAPTAPAPVLERVVMRRGGVAATPVEAAHLAVGWRDRDLRVQARSLSFADPSALRYQWQLGGLDGDWSDGGSEREFAQLPPGNYTLRARAAWAGGAWSAPGAQLDLEVDAPPWRRPFAYAAYAVAIAVLLFGALRGYRARLKRRHAYELAEQRQRLAERASIAKGEFLANMGHEIRTPMTGLLGMAELMSRTPLSDAQRGQLDAIRESGRMLLQLVNQALDLARIEAGRLELAAAPLDLRAVFDEVAVLATALASAKALVLQAQVDAGAPHWVIGDALRVKQVMLNLAGNAVKFSERGVVRLALARTAGGAARFCVDDEGPGITPAQRAQLFQRFAQADGPQRAAGSGLGLAICAELVAAMGGSIDVQSTPGFGSRFVVCLPLRDTDVPPSVQQPAAAVDASNATALRVLLVEDDATAAAAISGLLRAQSHVVSIASQALAALAEVATTRFDAVFIDLDLPGVDGLALARMLRAEHARQGTPRVRLIGISARSRGDEDALCRDAGMDAFVRKPLGGAALAQALQADRAGGAG